MTECEPNTVFAREEIEKFLRNLYEELKKSDLDLYIKLSIFKNANMSLEIGYMIGIMSCTGKSPSGKVPSIIGDINTIFNLLDLNEIDMENAWDRLEF